MFIYEKTAMEYSDENEFQREGEQRELKEEDIMTIPDD